MSIPADEVLRRLSKGDLLTPTDKSYKAYIGENHEKFYFDEWTITQQDQFIDLVDSGKVNIAHPGHLFITPFFMRRMGHDES